MRFPLVYRYMSPDGRSWVGSVQDGRRRNAYGICRSNAWLEEAFRQYPPETFTYEELEWLPPGCAEEKLRAAEQRYINRFHSWAREFGFNILPAKWKGNSLGQRVARQRASLRTKRQLAEQRLKWQARQQAAARCST